MQRLYTFETRCPQRSLNGSHKRENGARHSLFSTILRKDDNKTTDCPL